jgi:glycosyltransferase involved in cell wall biosynthesis
MQPQNIGAVANFNACLKRATGEFFLLLSDDDILQPTAIERLSAAFLAPAGSLASNTIGLTWSPCHIVNAEGQRMWTAQGGPPTESPVSLILALFNGNRATRLVSLMVRTDDAIVVGGYDQERYGPLCDMGNWMRVALKYPLVACINEPLASYTMHQMSGSSQGALHDWLPFVENFNEDLAGLLASHQDAASKRQIRIACRNNISNVLATILLQRAAIPGQLSHVLHEIIHWRKYLLTLFVAQRIVRDGWKIFRLWQRGSS